MDTQELRERLEDLFDEMSDANYIELHNAVTDDYSSDGKIYYMDDFDAVAGGLTPTEIADDTSIDFTTSDAYFTYDEANEVFHSFTDLLASNSPVDRDAIIDNIIETGESYGDAAIDELLQEAGVY